jgi:hypothetical protein
MADVKRRAAVQGKVLLTFSHYAMAPTEDPRPGQYAETDEDAADRDTTALLASTGIGVHFSGHSHVCNIGRWHEGGVALTDVALPALCSFPPAFRVLQARPDSVAVTTVPVRVAPGSDSLIAAYQREAASDPELTPALEVLAASRDFGDFMSRQLGVAVRRILARKHFGAEFRVLAETPLDECVRRLGATGISGIAGVTLIEALGDWYRLSRAGELALPYVVAERRAAYAALGRQLAKVGNETGARAIVRRLLVQLGEMAAAPYATDLTLPN